MKSIRWFISYIVVASLGLGVAFLLSARFMSPALSQNAPSSGELPPEFLNEVEGSGSGNQKGEVKNSVPAQNPPAGASQDVNAKSAGPGPLDVNSKKEANPKSQTASGSAPGDMSPPDGKSGRPQEGNGAIPPPPSSSPVGDSATAVNRQSSEYLLKDNYVYDPTGRRDPFAPFRIIQNLKADPVKEAINLEPLQRFDIDAIKVIGILWDVNKPRAMVKDPSGIVHIITKNTKIGRNEGVVATIREGEVVVIENRIQNGKVLPVPAILELKK